MKKITILLPSNEFVEPPQLGHAMTEKEVNKKNTILNNIYPKFF